MLESCTRRYTVGTCYGVKIKAMAIAISGHHTVRCMVTFNPIQMRIVVLSNPQK